MFMYVCIHMHIDKVKGVRFRVSGYSCNLSDLFVN